MGVVAAENAYAIVWACGAVVMILVVMTLAAVAWGRHGMFPTKGAAGFWARRIPPVRRRYEKWNREFGWGDMGDDDQAEGPGSR